MPDLPPLTEGSLSPDPLAMLLAWLADAEATGMRDPWAMTIATAGSDGRPSARTVLLRGVDADGLRFYTNRGSLKGRQLAGNPRAQLLFHWRELGRQVCVHGSVEETSDADSDAYFASRDRGSQLGAWASRQGVVIADREELLRRVSEASERFSGGDVPRPPYWGGYVVRPEAIELWQLGEHRLHDRFVYVRDGSAPGGWRTERLSP